MEFVRNLYGQVVRALTWLRTGKELKINQIVKENYMMTDTERRDFMDVVKAMSTEEMEIVADTIPVELCLARIEKEIGKAKDMRDSIKAMSSLI